MRVKSKNRIRMGKREGDCELTGDLCERICKIKPLASHCQARAATPEAAGFDAGIWNSTLKVNEINVETFKGVVQLSGFVRSQADIDKTVQVARGVAGVKASRTTCGSSDGRSSHRDGIA
jgi:hypothetical protein